MRRFACAREPRLLAHVQDACLAQFGGFEQVVAVDRKAEYPLYLRRRLVAHEAPGAHFGLLRFAHVAFELHVCTEFGDTAARDAETVDAVLYLHQLAADGQDEELLLSTADGAETIVERDGADVGLVVV